MLNLEEEQTLQVAYTHGHAYMGAPVPQGSRCFFCVLYISDVTISYVTRVVVSVTLFRTGSESRRKSNNRKWISAIKYARMHKCDTNWKEDKRKGKP